MLEERLAKFEKVLAHRQPDLTLIMENIHDPLNVAAVLRTCDSVGIQEIFVLNTIAPWHDLRKGHKTSRGTVKWIDVHTFDDLESCVAAVRMKYDRILATHLNAAAKELYEVDFTKQATAIVFGNEHDGISHDLLTHCDGNFIIPQVGHCQSLNISVACAITIYEAFRQKKIAGHYDEMRLPKETQHRLELEWKMKYK